jgi:hypothetical protein
MRNNSGTTARRRPSFDSLEDRCLLNGDASLSLRWPQALSIPVGPAFLWASTAFSRPGVSRTPSSSVVPVIPSAELQQRSFDPNTPTPFEGSSPFASDRGSSFRDYTPFQFPEISLFQPDETIALPQIIILLIRAEPQPGSQSPLSAEAQPSSGGGAAAKSPAPIMAPERADLARGIASADSIAPGVAATVAEKAAIVEPSTTTFAQVGSAAGLPPAQLLPPIDAGSRPTMRLVAQDDRFPGVNQFDTAGLTIAVNVETHHSPRTLAAAAASRSSAISSASLAEDWSEELPRPNGADLIAGVMPFDRSSLVRAIDRFFEEFDNLGHSESASRNRSHIFILPVTLACTLAALELFRRRWRYWTGGGNEARVRHPLQNGVPIGFPELPGSWSSRLT